MQVLNILWHVLAGLFILIFGIKWGWEAHKAHMIEKVSTLVSQFKAFRSKDEVIPNYIDIIEGKRYSTLDSKCIATSETRHGKSWLFRTTNNAFFTASRNSLGYFVGIIPLNQEQAVTLFSNAQKKEVDFKDAFPNVKVTDA